VAVAFLFGSQLSGNVHPESDVDITVHEYETIYVEIIKSILQYNLKELEVFFRYYRLLCPVSINKRNTCSIRYHASRATAGKKLYFVRRIRF